MIRLRPWRGWSDLDGMQAVAATGLALAPDREYVHPGDVAWWVGSLAGDRNELEHVVRVWERAGRIVGFGVEDDGEIAEYADPRIAEPESFFAAIDRWLADRPHVVRYADDGDVAKVARLRRVGWRATDDGLHRFTRSLEGLVRSPDPHVSSTSPDDDPSARLAITHAAFGVATPFQRYVEEYRAFMRSPAFPVGWDLVARTPEGEAASCCLAWPDPVSGVGNFEPVATDPAFTRQGYATAVMNEGLGRLAAAGMRRAIVRTPVENEAAFALYRSLGFELVGFLRAFVRR